MTDFKTSGTRGKTIRWQIAATKTLANGTVQDIDLTIAGTRLNVNGRLNPADAAPLFTKTYIQGGGGVGVTVPAPGGADPKTAEILIPPTEAGILALTKTSYVMVEVELVEPDGTETAILKGVIKVRVGVGA